MLGLTLFTLQFIFKGSFILSILISFICANVFGATINDFSLTCFFVPLNLRQPNGELRKSFVGKFIDKVSAKIIEYFLGINSFFRFKVDVLNEGGVFFSSSKLEENNKVFDKGESNLQFPDTSDN